MAYLTGYLKAGGYHDVTFIDAMTHHLSDEQVRERLVALKPDVVGCTAITPAIYKAEGLLKLAKDLDPNVVTVLGGIHGTFMYPQVLKEAPWIDAVVRGEGEQVFLNLVRAVDDGSWLRDPLGVRGIALVHEGKVVATPAEPTIKDLDRITPDWGILEWDKYIYIPVSYTHLDVYKRQVGDGAGGVHRLGRESDRRPHQHREIAGRNGDARLWRRRRAAEVGRAWREAQAASAAADQAEQAQRRHARQREPPHPGCPAA